MIKLPLLLLIIKVFVHLGANGLLFHSVLNVPDERTLYGWHLEVLRNGAWINYCHGLFIGPKVFLTHSDCVNTIYKNDSINVVNRSFKSPSLKTKLTVNHKNIYFGEYMSRNYSKSDRQFALVITNEQVLPKSNYIGKWFVKVASDITHIDYKKCFMPKLNPPIIMNVPCKLSSSAVLHKKSFKCSYDKRYDMWQENSLFCRYKKSTQSIVLVGFAENENNDYENKTISKYNQSTFVKEISNIYEHPPKVSY
ncbi:uncharacterized protein LOC130674230 [Microplitis mediator]|uniref:uncharacterized protein LOC130674230 n=1 Tax=Microplitis mediator TaxID=375433 RepID=UPI00255566F1|nr:uncharacterized protein LOC130674230 [Microplitis mediator]